VTKDMLKQSLGHSKNFIILLWNKSFLSLFARQKSTNFTQNALASNLSLEKKTLGAKSVLKTILHLIIN